MYVLAMTSLYEQIKRAVGTPQGYIHSSAQCQ